LLEIAYVIPVALQMLGHPAAGINGFFAAFIISQTVSPIK
jgi:hypothetical protein